jgi:hypothetical protein
MWETQGISTGAAQGTNRWVSFEATVLAVDETNEHAAAEIRSQIGEILELLPRLGPDKASTRLEMQGLLADLREVLRSIEVPGGEEMKSRWAEAAGTKPEIVTEARLEPPVDYGRASEQKQS